MATRLAAVLVVLVAAACGEPRSPASPEGRGADPGAAIASAKVYDAHGTASACGAAPPDCPPIPKGDAFLDRCRMAGFVVRQCGCEMRCSGDVSAAARHYDADGHPRECAPARADCTPPQAGSAFQDACTEHGFRLDVCGCDWACSGDFKR